MAGEKTPAGASAAAKTAGKQADAEIKTPVPGDGQTGDAGQETGAKDGSTGGAAAGAVGSTDTGTAQAGTAQPPGESVIVQQGGAAPAGQPSAPERVAVAIEVISRVDGFWRGNRQWGHEPQTVPLDELAGRQLAEILAEPLLITRMIYRDGE